MDIGNSVLVDAKLLERLKLSAGTQAAKLAHNLLRAVFTPKEMSKSSLYRKPCDVKKDAPTKKALDRARLGAMVCKYIMLPPSTSMAQNRDSHRERRQSVRTYLRKS